MDAVKFFKERNRMCKSYYDPEKDWCSDKCPALNIQCNDMEHLEEDTERLVETVEKWSQENPRKTRQDLILEQWPNAQTCDDNVFSPCPKVFDTNFVCHFDFEHHNCNDCRREFWLKEVD